MEDVCMFVLFLVVQKLAKKKRTEWAKKGLPSKFWVKRMIFWQFCGCILAVSIFWVPGLTPVWAQLQPWDPMGGQQNALPPNARWKPSSFSCNRTIG